MARYAIVGAIGTAVHFGVLAALVEGLASDPVLASALGFVAALLVSYGLNHRWTFESSASHRIAFARYTVVSVAGLGVNTLIMYIAVHVLGLWYLLGQALVVVVVPAMNYALNRRWSFSGTD